MPEFDKNSGFFTAFRGEYGFPYFYQSEPPYFVKEIGLWGLFIAYILVVLALTVILAFLGTRGYSRWRISLQMVISLAIGFSIIVAVTGHSWQLGTYMVKEGDVETDYHVHIGLKQANITAESINTTDGSLVEYYNVKIGWTEGTFLVVFMAYITMISSITCLFYCAIVYQAEMEYRQALIQGWPLPILKIAHYLSVDMGGMRYMRDFRWSGYAAYILLWIAFTFWLLANVLIGSTVSNMATALLVTGAIQLVTCIVYDSEQPDNFYVPLDRGEEVLRFSYGWMFWITIFTGIFVVVLSIVLLVLDYLRPEDMNKFFGTESEIQTADGEELKINQNKDVRQIIRSVSVKRTSLRRRVNGRTDETRNDEQNGHVHDPKQTHLTVGKPNQDCGLLSRVPEIDVENVELQIVNTAEEPKTLTLDEQNDSQTEPHVIVDSQTAAGPIQDQTDEENSGKQNGHVAEARHSIGAFADDKKSLIKKDDD